MACDLILGRTRRNLSRGACAAPSSTPPPVSDEVTLRLTEPEMAMLADLAATKMRADLGDRQATARLPLRQGRQAPGLIFHNPTTTG